MHDAHIDRLTAEITDYLAAHPEAADTAEGVAQWWVGRQRYDRLMAAVEAALTRLVAQGVVSCREAADGTVYYCRGSAATAKH